MDAQVGGFREVLPQKTIGVLVRASLPGFVGFAKVDREVGGDCDVFVAGKLGALVPGQRSSQMLR